MAVRLHTSTVFLATPTLTRCYNPIVCWNARKVFKLKAFVLNILQMHMQRRERREGRKEVKEESRKRGRKQERKKWKEGRDGGWKEKRKGGRRKEVKEGWK